MSNAIDEYYDWLDKENIRLMDELITTRKALDVAVDALDVISQITNQIDVCDVANDALNCLKKDNS